MLPFITEELFCSRIVQKSNTLFHLLSTYEYFSPILGRESNSLKPLQWPTFWLWKGRMTKFFPCFHSHNKRISLDTFLIILTNYDFLEAAVLGLGRLVALSRSWNLWPSELQILQSPSGQGDENRCSPKTSGKLKDF